MRSLRRWWPLVILGAFVLVFGSCTASQVPYDHAASIEPVPGFWKGFWHGFIAPISFIVSLFTDDVRVYAFPNTGRWYDFGFMLGIHGFSGGLFAGARRRTVRSA
jgi:hypothetical protein